MVSESKESRRSSPLSSACVVLASTAAVPRPYRGVEGDPFENVLDALAMRMKSATPRTPLRSTGAPLMMLVNCKRQLL